MSVTGRPERERVARRYSNDNFMDFIVKGGNLQKQRTGCIVVGVYEGGKLSPSAMELDIASGHAVNEALNRGDLEGELGTVLLLSGIPNVAAERGSRNGGDPSSVFDESDLDIPAFIREHRNKQNQQ